MAQGQPGADSSSPVTSSLIQQATTLFGATPVFWGRYFTSVSTTGSVEYRHATENQPLNAAGIRLLPIARQTMNVGKDEAQGQADGAANALDFITTFGITELQAQGGRFKLFLDVEGERTGGNPSLNEAYYIGWAQGLANEAESLSSGAIQILPCLYGAQGDDVTWNALQAATAAGVPCGGVWMARYYTGNCAMDAWQSNIVTPTQPTPFPFQILAWQYAGNCLSGQIDCSQTNPETDLENDLLQYLVLPPA